ncbi:BZ3500_MvSof-1268-A1-R1_Chr4-1g06762 [Microbotryum saponariae]|uniref:BZ3500_MvSof-1268-A1-R1_Chr4-1g06762 protein n=1 Tax=Microbotryum saponariae TaxID=289078 RepID=A0A2X0KS05_9BASI|nr:BZ3500_MvSof-1268-A1-R1_Chr4-1g06762 [Microbotryum saponariae]
MPPIAEFSGESQSSDVATYTGCFRSGQEGGGGMLPLSGGEAVAKDSLEASPEVWHFRNTRRRMIRKKRTQNRLFG